MREGLAWRLPSRFLPGVPGPGFPSEASVFHPRRRLSPQPGISRLVASASRRVDIDRGHLGPAIAMPVLSRRRDEIRESVRELKHRDLHDAARPWLRGLSLSRDFARIQEPANPASSVGFCGHLFFANSSSVNCCRVPPSGGPTGRRWPAGPASPSRRRGKVSAELRTRVGDLWREHESGPEAAESCILPGGSAGG